jgi:hypothetical protein
MALKSSEVRVAGTGELYLGPVGTVLPTDTTTALGAAFKGYGYTTEDGVTLAKAVNRDGVPAWQSITPVRYVTTSLEFTIAMSFLQSNDQVLKLWLGSSDFAGTSPAFKADVSTSPVDQNYAMVLEWSDDTLKTRLTAAKVTISEVGDVTIARQAATYPCTLSVLPPDTGSVLASWYVNDVAFDPAS